MGEYYAIMFPLSSQHNTIYYRLYKVNGEFTMQINLDVRSPAFRNDGFIPVKYTGKGKDISLPLTFGPIVCNAESVSIIMDDPDAPMGTFTHWLIWNIPAIFFIIPEGIPCEAVVFSLGYAFQGRNDFGRIGYEGPLPPPGPPHSYRIKVYILDTFLYVKPGADKTSLEEAMNGHILQFGILRGKFG
jgi:Raf kinase inhibitor-like YbhB/YbcL family protein